MTSVDPLPIAVNASMVGTRPTGLGYYALNVIHALDRLGEHQTVYTSCPSAFSLRHGALRPVPAAVRPERGGRGHLARLVWGQASLRLALRRSTPSLLLNLVPEGIIGSSTPQVTTVFDLVPLLYPADYPRHYHYFKHYVPLVLRHSRAIVVISDSTRRDLLRFYDLDPGKVHVAPCGYDAWRFSPDGGEAAVGTEPYALYVGNVMPHKNLLRLVDAFARVVAELPARLVICGWGRAVHLRALEARIAAHGIEGDVQWRPYVPAVELARLYRGARMVLLPSLYEGFGLTALEAMASGTPVVASNTAALPEVVGDAALTVDPLDTEAIAAAMARVFTDDRLAKDFRERGLARAGCFSWERTGRAVRQALRQVM